MGILIAVLAAAVYGSGDFYGGLSAKKNSVWTVTAVSSVVGLAMVLAATPFLSLGSPPRTDFVFGAEAGCVSVIGLSALYRGLAIGRMSVVAPITAVIASVIPVGVGFAHGERPGTLVWVGIVLAVVAVALVSSASQEDISGAPGSARRGIAEAFVAGAGFGIIYVMLSQTSHGLWPLVAMRSVSLVLSIVLGLVLRQSSAVARGSARSLVLAGLGDMGGNILYIVALRYTLLSIAAVLTSLYPAATVLLARMVLNERLRALQWVGVGCAFAGIALIAAG